MLAHIEGPIPEGCCEGYGTVPWPMSVGLLVGVAMLSAVVSRWRLGRLWPR